MRHYRIDGQKIQAGQANENGDVEQRHYRFKEAVDQALMMRGSRDFPERGRLSGVLRKLFTRLNAGRRERYLEEVSTATSLCRSSGSIRCGGNGCESVRAVWYRLVAILYSVHSRLIGEMVEARVHPDTVEIWYGDRKVEELPRLRGRSKHRVDYRHIIDWLVRKPGAFENYRYRSDLFPTSWFRLAYDALREEQGPKRGAQEYLAILLLAARRGEAGWKERFGFCWGAADLLNARTKRLD